MSLLRRARSPKVAAALAVVVLATVLTTGPAAAIEVVPTPPGWGSGAPGSPGAGGGGQITTDCARNRAYTNGRLYYENYPGCWYFNHGGRRWNWLLSPRPGQNRVFCTHTFEVWRFYGTFDRPTQVRTVSRINVDPCKTSIAPLVHDGHPEDSSRTPILGQVVPYRRAVEFSDRVGMQASIATARNASGSTVFVFTTNWPFRRNGWCNSLMSRDPKPPQGQQYETMANSWRQLANRWGEWWADVAMDRVGGTWQRPVFGNNGIDCSSGPVDFAVPARQGVDPATQGDRRITGYCAIPVWREHRRFVNPVTGADVYIPASPTATGYNGTHEVYSRYYGAYSTNKPRTPQNNRILDAMRKSVADEVYLRPLVAQTPGIYPEDKVRPPRVEANDPNLLEAAMVAGAYSHCSFSSSNTFADGTQSSEKAAIDFPGDGVILYAEVPQAGAVGGEHRPTTIRTRLATGPGGSEVRCGDSWCNVTADGPRLTAVDLDLSDFLQVPDGVEYKVLNPLRPDPRTGTADNPSTELRLAFWRATGAGAPVRLHIGQSKATIEGTVGSDTRVVTCGPFGGGCVTHVLSERRNETREVPVEVRWVRSLDTLEPVTSPEFPVVGPTATPIEGRGN